MAIQGDIHNRQERPTSSFIEGALSSSIDQGPTMVHAIGRPAVAQVQSLLRGFLSKLLTAQVWLADMRLLGSPYRSAECWDGRGNAERMSMLQKGHESRERVLSSTVTCFLEGTSSSTGHEIEVPSVP